MLTQSWALTDPGRQRHPDPCGDCGRTYLHGERVEWRVPALPSGTRLAWHGCIDCFLRRTDPSDGLAASVKGSSPPSGEPT